VNGGVTLIIPHLENDFVIFIFIIPLKKDWNTVTKQN
jgi:hypothetical protein